MAKQKPKRTPYWTRVIEQATARKKAGGSAFTDEQKLKAGGWTVCACGKQDKRIPRDRWRTPKDERLANLGGDFDWYVQSDEPEQAGIVLRQIERRAAEVLAEVTR